MINSLKIYIAAPYSAETKEERGKNTKAVIDIALTLFKKGHFPYIPHLTHWVDERAKGTGIAMKWEDYMKWHRPWLEACDAFFYLNSSKGTDLELQMAKKLRKTIFYSIDEVPVAQTLEAKQENKKKYIESEKEIIHEIPQYKSQDDWILLEQYKGTATFFLDTNTIGA